MRQFLASRGGLAAVLVAVVIIITIAFGYASGLWRPERPLPSFRSQACGLPPNYLLRTQRGYMASRAGQISILPQQPAYFSSGAGGWSHSGPWPYLQDVPLVFYGPGIVPEGVGVDRPVTVADMAPTVAELVGADFRPQDGSPLREVLEGARRRPRLVLTIVWDGGGWNTLRRWPRSWENLEHMIDEGVSYSRATIGSNPSVTPSVHTTIGTGEFPWRHGITDIPVFDERGKVVDAFELGASSRFIEVPALAERWDEQNDNAAEIGMVGYEPWHLGMIGQGAERSGGDKDDAVWLDVTTNEWASNPDHYSMPESLTETSGLEGYERELDEKDGEADDTWRNDVPLDDPERTEETPAFVRYHTAAMINLMEKEGYGSDDVADLIFTNYKQIDRVGHYFNFKSDYVDDVLVESDKQLPLIFEALDRIAGPGRWVVALTADHGQQPDESDIDGYGINPRELESDIRGEFGDVVDTVRPTEIFLKRDALEREGVSVEDVARFVGRYTLSDNAPDLGKSLAGAGSFDPSDRLFALSIPNSLLSEIDCDAGLDGG